MIGNARDGSDILHAVALVRAALYQRKARRFVTIDEMFEAVGMHAVAPEPTPEVAAFLAAEEAMKQAA